MGMNRMFPLFCIETKCSLVAAEECCVKVAMNCHFQPMLEHTTTTYQCLFQYAHPPIDMRSFLVSRRIDSMWTDICPRIFILEVPDAISNSSGGICEGHAGEKSKITLQWGPLTKRHFIRVSFGRGPLTQLKAVESSSRSTCNTAERRYALHLRSSARYATSSIIPICSCGPLCFSFCCSNIHVRPCFPKAVLKVRKRFSVQNLISWKPVQVTFTCRNLVHSRSTISARAFSLCSNGMAAAFGRRFFSHKGNRRERNVQVSILTQIFLGIFVYKVRPQSNDICFTNSLFNLKYQVIPSILQKHPCEMRIYRSHQVCNSRMNSYMYCYCGYYYYCYYMCTGNGIIAVETKKLMLYRRTQVLENRY